MMWSRRRVLQLTAVMSVLLVCYAIFLQYISRTIQYDEAITFMVYSKSPFYALWGYTTPNNHLLYSFLVWISTGLMGDSLIAIRFPAFMASMLSLAYVYRIGFKLKGHLVGLLALGFLAAMPLFTEYIPNGRGYSLSVLLSLVFFDMAFFGNGLLKRHQQYMLLLVSAFLVMTLPTMLLLIGPILLWIFFRFRAGYERRVLISYVMPILSGSMIGTLFYSYGFISGSLQSFSSRFGIDSPVDLIAQVIRQADLAERPAIFVLLVLGGLVMAWNKHRKFVSIIIIILSVAIILAFAQEIVTGRVLFPRNYVYLTAFFALVMALGLAEAVDRLTRHTFILVALILLLLAGVASNAVKLGQKTPVDELVITLEEYTSERDALYIGCCLDYPIFYINRNANALTSNAPVERHIVIPTEYFGFEDLRLAMPETLQCEEDQWHTFDVHICTETSPS